MLELIVFRRANPGDEVLFFFLFQKALTAAPTVRTSSAQSDTCHTQQMSLYICIYIEVVIFTIIYRRRLGAINNFLLYCFGNDAVCVHGYHDV